MQICPEEVRKVSKRRPVHEPGTCVLSCTSETHAKERGYIGKVASLNEDEYVGGSSRADAFSKALKYATDVLLIPISRITFEGRSANEEAIWSSIISAK